MTADAPPQSSLLSGFYRLSPAQRIDTLRQAGLLDDADADQLAAEASGPSIELADKMIENVIGVFELPIGVGLNFRINGRDHVVPMVVEEPSIVAAVSHVARIVHRAGGFIAEADDPVMIGQVQVVGLDDLDAAAEAVREHAERLIAIANEREPNMRRRGGGAIGVDVRPLPHTPGKADRMRDMLVVHLLVDCRDAMGANLVNTMAEAIAPEVERVTGGTVFLRILSNLTDRRRVRSRCRIPVEDLAWKTYSGAQVADGVVRASRFAEACPYRAATHNKGIMNGIDAVALATGQDWRAIEAGAHAWAARDGRYGPLARWWLEDDHLIGEIDVPMAVGLVGGPIRLHPRVQLLLRLLDVGSAADLACVLGSVGLAQNLAAIKALGTTGIQAGHMALHARSVAATAGATGDLVEQVAAELVASGDIKVERARDILRRLSPTT